MIEKRFVNKEDGEICMTKDEYNSLIAETHDKYMMKIDALKNENKQLKAMNRFLNTALVEALNYLKEED